MTQRLVEVDAAPRWTGSKSLVRLTACPTCGEPMDSVTHHTAALFRHGGYGATRSSTTWYCVLCAFHGGTHTTETNPRRLA